MRCLPKGFFRRDLVVYNSDWEFEAPFLLYGSFEVLPLLASSELGLSLGGGHSRGDICPPAALPGWGHCKEPSQTGRQKKKKNQGF